MSPGVSKRIGPLPRALLFLCIFGALSFGWSAQRGTRLESIAVHTITVRPAAFFANLLTPSVQARAVDSSLRAPGGGLNILNGCEGFDAVFLLIAAFAVAPLNWKSRVLGLLLGTAVAFVINQARILALFYAYRKDPTLFDFLHATVAPIAVITTTAGFFYVWLRSNAQLAKPR